MKYLVAISLLLTGCGVLDNNSRQDSADQRMDNLQGQINTLFAALDANTKALNQLKKQLTDLLAANTINTNEIVKLQDLIRQMQMIINSQQSQIFWLLSHSHKED